jgi:hypothetical protein
MLSNCAKNGSAFTRREGSAAAGGPATSARGHDHLTFPPVGFVMLSNVNMAFYD